MSVMFKANLENSMGLFVLSLFTKYCAHFGYDFLVFLYYSQKKYIWIILCFLLIEISPISYFISNLIKKNLGINPVSDDAK